jgi:uncharacterized protein (DUF433 family)
MENAESYVRLDEHGVMRVGKTRVMLDSVVLAFQQGHSPETIQQQYPSLTLEEVYGAVTHYLAHQQEIDRYLKRQDEVWNDWRDRAERTPNPVVQRLRSQIVNAKSQTP